MPNPILVVDDEVNIRHVISAYLRRAGYAVVTAGSGEEALAACERHRPALVVLDLMLPDMDGREVCRQLRAHSNVPVLMLTGFSEEADQIAGLMAGADDYVVKPSSPRQIVARVQAILRRSGYDAAQLQSGGIMLDMTAQTVTVNGKRVSLTAREFALLETLLRQPGRAFSRADLISACWEPGYTGVDRVVDVHISSLRRKLGRMGKVIVAVRGLGYRLERRND